MVLPIPGFFSPLPRSARKKPCLSRNCARRPPPIIAGLLSVRLSPFLIIFQKSSQSESENSNRNTAGMESNGNNTRIYWEMLFRTVWNSKGRSSVGLSWLVRSFSVSSRAPVEMAAKDGELKVFIVSGEVSGDTIGSRLMASLKGISPFPIQFAGVGGPMMFKQGLKPIFPMEDIAVMGIWELLPHLNKFRMRLKQAIESAFLFQPHVVVTVDSKGFSFRFLKQLRARYNQQGLVSPIHHHFVAPSFWAWKGGEARLKGLTEFVDHVFCILPYEEEVCRSNGLAATFVGHPILEDALELDLGKNTLQSEWKVQGNSDDFRSQHGIASGATVISLLPGSRLQEVTRMLSIFSNTVGLLKSSISDLTTIIHVAPNQHVKDYVSRTTHNWPGTVKLIPGGSPNLKYDAFSASRVALCTSGTVAVEMQLARVPCVVAYRAHFLTEWFIRWKAKIPFISIPNILLDSATIPEALLQACTPAKLAALLMELILDESQREKQVVAAEKVLTLLSPPQKIINNPVLQDLGLKSVYHTPSMIAASTILHYAKPR